MQRNSNRRGFALGAIFALFASLFSALPASATNAVDGSNIAVVAHANSETNLTGLLNEDFPIAALLVPGQSNANFADTKFKFKVTRLSGNMNVALSTMSSIALVEGVFTPDSVSGTLVADPAGAVPSASAIIWATQSEAVVIAGVKANDAYYLNVKAHTASGVTTSSPQTVIQVIAWIDEFNGQNGEIDPVEWRTTKTITLVNTNAVSATTTLTAINDGDTQVTVSSTVGTVNWGNLSGTLFLGMGATQDTFLKAVDGTSLSSTVSALSAATVHARAGVVSFSFDVADANGITESISVSAALRYVSVSSATPVYDAGSLLGSLKTSVAAAPGADSLTVAVAADAANVRTATSPFYVRPNQTYTVTVVAKTNSATVSNAAVSVKLSGTALSAVSPAKRISINGGAFTTSYPTALAVATGTSGVGSFTLTTEGFVDTNYIIVNGYIGNLSASSEVQADAVEYTLTNNYDTLTTTPGTAASLGYQVKDQFGVLASATNLRIAATRGGTGFNYATTLSYIAVSGGKAAFDFTPAPATATGSATVVAALQKWDDASGAWIAYSPATSDTATINVTSTANAFSTGLAPTFSASVSYWPSTVSWVAVTGTVENTGSAIVVSSAGLKFQDANGDTSSDTITVRAGSGGAYAFSFSAELAGTYTLTLTNGTAVTTSKVTVDPAAHDAGKTVTFDTTTIEPGKTRIVTGYVRDMNGNAVDTTGGAGTASVLVTFAGTAGIPVGAMPTETDADGKFQVSILTSAKDSGTFTLTATYLKAGAATAAAAKVTTAQVITVGTVAASADQKITVGTFKGFVAIYTKGYMGQKLSAKVAGKWLVVDPIAAYKSNDYSRTVRLTGAGYTIAVDLYIDGAFVRSEVVTTK